MNIFKQLIANYVKDDEAIMAAALQGKKQEQYIELMRKQKILERIVVKTWREAHQAAIDIEDPKREELMKVFDDTMIDTHLKTVCQTRMMNLQNVSFEIIDIKSGEPDEEATKLLHRQWFYKLLGFVVEAVLYGYSPLKFTFDQSEVLKWEVDDITIFHRDHVVPEWQAIRIDVDGSEIIELSQPPYHRFYLIIDTQDLGLLLNCARFTIFKKQAINHWSRYQEVFGIPPLIVKSNSRDSSVNNKIDKGLKNTGSELHLRVPMGTEVEFPSNPNASDPYNVFLQAAEYADKQISKVVLGQTMTTDDGSSKSQSEVHERTLDSITRADIRLAEHVFNKQVIPLLLEWGYPLEGKALKANLSSKLKLADSQLAIDQWIAKEFDIKEEYIEETYGTPIEGRKQSLSEPKEGDPNQDPKKDEPKKGPKKEDPKQDDPKKDTQPGKP